MTLITGIQASANGPAYIAELSAVYPVKSDSVTVTIPIGSHVAMAVYNTDALTVNAPLEVDNTIRVMWLENRTVFAGMFEEKDVAIPYYLPELKDCTPTGSWVIELKPQAIGEYVIPIQCNTNIVTVNLTCIDLPQSDIGYGFYTDYARFPDPLMGPVYYNDMAQHGMNTFTPYARELPASFGVDNTDGAALLAWHINTAIEQGLCDKRFPLFCLSAGYDNLKDARQYAKYEWPELVGYNRDEPSLEHGPDVAETAAKWKAAGVRNGTAIDGEIAKAIGGPVDIWTIHMDSMSQEAIDMAKAQGKERWLYNCSLRGSNAPLHRYMTGLYTWAVAPKVCLIWTYTHDPLSRINPDGTWNMLRVYDTASCDADGLPIPTVALEGLQDGIIDSRLLQEVERLNTPEGNHYLEMLRGQIDMKFWPQGRNRDYSKSYVWDIPDVSMPPIDMCIMRKELLRLREQALR